MEAKEGMPEQAATQAVQPIDLHPKLKRNDQLSRADFLEVIEANRDLLNGCLKRHGTAGKQALIEVSIRSSGKPTSVQIGGARPKLNRCLQRAIKSLRFKTFRGPSVSHRTQLKP
jgi:hypothetical protein